MKINQNTKKIALALHASANGIDAAIEVAKAEGVEFNKEIALKTIATFLGEPAADANRVIWDDAFMDQAKAKLDVLIKAESEKLKIQYKNKLQEQGAANIKPSPRFKDYVISQVTEWFASARAPKMLFAKEAVSSALEQILCIKVVTDSAGLLLAGDHLGTANYDSGFIILDLTLPIIGKKTITGSVQMQGTAHAPVVFNLDPARAFGDGEKALVRIVLQVKPESSVQPRSASDLCLLTIVVGDRCIEAAMDE